MNIFTPKTGQLDLKALLNFDVEPYLQGNGDTAALEGLYSMLHEAYIDPAGISKEHLLHVVQVLQLLSELQHALWIDSEGALTDEKQSSLKLKSQLQKATDMLKERQETASLVAPDQAQAEITEYKRQVADYKSYIEQVEEDKRLLEADLDHLANELEKFRDRGTNYHDEEIVYLQNEKEKLEREIRYVETDLDRSKDALQREKQAYADLQEELKSAKRMAMDLEDQVDNYKQEIMEYRRQLNDQNNRLSSKNKEDRDAKSQLTLKEKETMKLAKRVTELEEINSTIQSEVKDLTEELVALGHENDTIQKEVLSTREAYSDAQDKVDELEKEKEKLVNHLHLLEARVGDKNNGDEAFLSEIAQKVQKWKNLLDSKDIELMEREKEIAHLQSLLSSNQVEQQDMRALLQRSSYLQDSGMASMDDLRLVVKDRDAKIIQLNNQLKTLQGDMEILSLELVRLEDAEKIRAPQQSLPRVGNENLQRKIDDLQMELNQERTKFRQEYFTVEEEKKEMIALRARMDEYERGVYGLSEAMAELRQEKAKLKYREQDILKLSTTVNKLEQQQLKLEEENLYLKQKTGVTDVEGLLLTTKAKSKLKDQLEIERLRSLNTQLESEVASLEQERLQLKSSLRVQAFGDGERYLRLGLSKRDAALLDELIASKDHNIPENPEDMKKEIRRLMALIKRSTEAIQVAQLDNQDLRDKMEKINKLEAKKPAEPTPPPLPTPVVPSKTKEVPNAELAELMKQRKQMMSEVEQLRSKLFQSTYESERKDATIKSLQDSLFLRNAQAAMIPKGSSNDGGGEAVESLNEQLIQCLEDLCAKEQFIDSLEGQLRSYSAQFQTLTDQQHVLYEEHVRNRNEHQQQVASLEKQLHTANIQCDQYKIQAEEYSKALGDASEDTLKGRVSELTRRVVLLRADSETVQRKYSYLVLEYEAITKELEKYKSDGADMEKSLQERMLFLELANTRLSTKLEALQSTLDKSVPAADFEILSRKFNLLTKQHEEALGREKDSMDNRITAEQRDQEVTKLITRVQELQAAVEVVNHKSAKLQEVIDTDPRYMSTAAGSSIRIAALEAELFNAEKQAQLARSRERATSETHSELEDRIRKLEVQVVTQVQRIQELSVAEADLRNQLVGTVSREEATKLEVQVATLTDEVSRMGVELSKQREIASIAAAQSITITANVESSVTQMSLLKAAVRDLQAKGDQEHLLGELYQRVAALQMSEASALHKSDHYRTEYQRLSLTHHKLIQRVDDFLTKHILHKEQHRTIIHAYHQQLDSSGALSGQRWMDKLMQIMDSYRGAEARITELVKNNRSLRDRHSETEDKIPTLELKVRELEGLIGTLRKGSLETERVAEWGSQAVTGKLELFALQRRIMTLQEHEGYLLRVQTALEATIRRMEEQSIKDELVWEQKARSHHMQARDLERRLLERERADDDAIKSQFEQAKATEPPSTSLPLNERLETALRQLEEAQKIISAQNSSILTLNTNTLALNAKVRTQEDLVLEKESQIHELNVRMAHAAVVEASSLVANANNSADPTVQTPATATSELRTLQTMYQFACNTIEGLRDMVASKEDAVLRYQQMIMQARDTHRRDRLVLEAEIQKLVERLSVYEDAKALKEITDDLKRAEQAPKPVPQESTIPSLEVEAMMHSKQHELREIASQLDVAREDVATTTIQLESAVKQRDHWKSKYESDLDDIRTRHAKEREMASTIEISEKEVIKNDNARLQKELNMQHHEIIRLKNELSAEVARAQLMEQEVQRAPSESVSRLVSQMRDQLNLKEKKLQTLQTAIAMLKQELVVASEAIAEKSIRENREEHDARTKDNKNKKDSSFISDEQVEPLIRRIEGLQEVIMRMKTDQATLSKAEGQLRTQIETLHRERGILAAESARNESAARAADVELKGYRRQLKEAQDSIISLEKQLSLAKTPSSIPKPAAPAKGPVPSSSAVSSVPEQRKSQTQLLRARTKNNNPPSRHVAQQKPKPQLPKIEAKPPPAKKKPEKLLSDTSGNSSSSDESDYEFDFDDDDDDVTTPETPKLEDKPKTDKTNKPTDNDNKAEDKNMSDTSSDAQDQMESDDEFIDQLLTEEVIIPTDNKPKNKDNKTTGTKPKTNISNNNNLPPPSKLKMPANISKDSAREDLPSKNMGKDNKPPNSSIAKVAAPENEDGMKKAIAMAKWEAEKKSQKQIETMKKKITTLSTENSTITQQLSSVKEALARVQSEKASLDSLYSTLKGKYEKEAQQYASLSPSVEHVLDLKSQITKLEDEVSRVTRIASVEKEQEINTLKQENAGLAERVRVLELLLTACRDDLGAKIPQQTKELSIIVPKLQGEAQSHADVVMAKDNLIMELRFDKEELRRAALRLQARIADLELITQIGGTGQSKGKEAELQSVVTALQSVAERLKSENESLKKSAVPMSKYMDVVKENKSIKQKLAEASKTNVKPPPKEEPATSLVAENDQLKRRLKRETETIQKQQKLIEDQEGVVKQQADTIKKLNQVQRTLETTVASTQETVRKKEADIKSLLYALEDAKENRDDDLQDDTKVSRLEEQLILKENDYVLLFGKYQDLEAENKDLRSDLGAFDEAFFSEIEDLKSNYQKALTLVAQYESKLGVLGVG